MGKKGMLAAFVASAWMYLSPAAHAEPGRGCLVLDRSNVASCVVAASLEVKAQEWSVESMRGRRQAAATLLPSNPVVTVTGGSGVVEPTVTSSEREPLWSATLSQEIEIGGQRGRRLEVVAAERRAQTERVSVVRRDATAAAWLLYFDAVAAAEEARLGAQLATLAGSFRAVAHGRAEAGVGAELEAQLADAAAARVTQAQLAAQSRVAQTRAALANAIGLDPFDSSFRIDGDLEPLAVPAGTPAAIVEAAIAQRGEVRAAHADAAAQRERVALYERLRVPNPMISVFARNDWINERLIGVGLSVPIPLPSPVGRTYAGEIAEAEALAARATTETDGWKRNIRGQVLSALSSYETRNRQRALYAPEQVQRTEDTLRSIAEELGARRLGLRDALISQQSLIDYLFASVEARRQLCFASVELGRAAGASLQGGTR